MSDFINNFNAIHHFIKGILSNSKGEYTLTFVQDPDDRWYIDMPWSGNRANLEMVAGADDLLTYFDTEKKHKVVLHVVPSEKQLTVENHTELRQIDKSTLGGSHYDTTDFEGFRMKKIWICPVTLCVLGCYPKYLYIQKIG
jgi:hypothetical protein